MKRGSLAIGFTWLAVLASGIGVSAQETTTTETGADGVTWRITQRVVQRSIPVTEYQTREQKSYRPQVTTEYQSYPQTYLTPVTQYHWVARQRGLWNPFAQPYWAHELTPITHWEARTSTVQIPVARTNWIEETRTTQVPVTTYRTVAAEHRSREPISAAPNSTVVAGGGAATSVASQPIGGTQLQSDPPRGGNPWSSSTSGTYRR